MIIDSLLIRGSIHEEYCEDAIFTTRLSNDWMIGCVMDGCSSAKDSYFASSLFVKLVSKACKTLPYLSKIQPELGLKNLSSQYIGEFILNQVFNDCKSTLKKLLLDETELLTTLLLAVVNTKTHEAWINISGDGFISINNDLIEIDQNNVPDYMSYHFNITFEEWLNKHTRIYEIKEVFELSLATDGIAKLMKKNGRPSNSTDHAKTLLSLNTKKTTELKKNYNKLTKNNKLIPFDDIGIIRFLD